MPDSTEQSLADAAHKSAPASGWDVVLRVSGLAKSFGATEALRDCSLELRRGEVLAIMGENASGKSTLVKILSGVHRADRGTLEVMGQSLPHLTSPRVAQTIGIATVFQEILIVSQQTVLAPSVSWNHIPSTSRSPSSVTPSARYSARRWTLPPSRILMTMQSRNTIG